MKKKPPKFHPQNERIKQAYFLYLKEADQKADSTIDGVRKSILRFENYTGFKDFQTFTKEQAVGFKKHLAGLNAEQSGKPMSKSTILSTVNNLKAFFKWLAYQKGYKPHIHIPDIEYFNMSEKEIRIAKSVQFKEFPTLEQIHKVIFSMSHEKDIEKRDRALVAFTILTGMRDSAIASLSLKHIDLDRDPVLVKQDPNEVKTKFSKRIETYFFPVGDDIRDIVLEWARYLKEKKLYGNDSPLFPRTKIGHDENHSYEIQGIEAVHWANATPIRKIFRAAFKNAGIRYFNPHTFRNTLADHGQRICKTPEQLKAWSQNLGHESVLTTFTSYGRIDPHRQGDVIKSLSKAENNEDKIDKLMRLVEGRLK